MSAFDPTAKVTNSGTIIQPQSERAPLRFAPGQMIAGIYRVERLVGEGGMGTVLAATHVPTGRSVALKVLQPDVADEAMVARFWREVRAMSRLAHPNIVRITDVGALADDTPYMAMELLTGETLAARIRAAGPMPVEAARGLLLQACDAVAAAHAIGVVHRDLKPDNMFLARGEAGGEVLKVLDFGISKAMRATVADDQQKLTRTTDVFGSPAYMSPEQLKASRDVDARTDVWSLGVILHEMLTGAAPFEGRTVAEIFGAILYKQPEPLERLRPDAPPELAAAVRRALEKDRDRRFATVEELRAAVVPGAKPAAAPAPALPAPAPPAAAPRRNLALAAALALLLAAALSFALSRWLL